MPRWTLLILALMVGLVGVAIAAAQESQGSTYTLQYGDYLDEIAASFDISVSCLAEASGIEDPNRVRPGDTLIIDRTCPPYDGLIEIEREPVAQDASDDEPGQGGGATTSTSSSGDGYTVQRGDVLDTIAAGFDVDVLCLAEANNLTDPGEIYPGDVLTIDLNCPRYDGEAFVPQPREELALGQGGGGGAGGSTYFVRVGDYLDRISAQFNVDTACLAEENNLANPHRIFPGDQLVIATNCPPYQGLALENIAN